MRLLAPQTLCEVLLPEFAERDVINPHSAWCLNDEAEVDIVRVAGVQHMSILAPARDILDVGSLGPLKISRQKERTWLRPAYQCPKLNPGIRWESDPQA